MRGAFSRKKRTKKQSFTLHSKRVITHSLRKACSASSLKKGDSFHCPTADEGYFSTIRSKSASMLQLYSKSHNAILRIL